MSTNEHNQEAKYGTWTYAYQEMLVAKVPEGDPIVSARYIGQPQWIEYRRQRDCTAQGLIQDFDEAIMFCQFMALALELDPIDWDTPVGRMMAALQEHLTPEQLLEWECNRESDFPVISKSMLACDLRRAIDRAFIFGNTPQGHGYWWALHESFHRKHTQDV